MSEPTARTIRLHRVLRCPPEKVYRAFLEADAVAKWLPPHGFTCKVLHMDARVGGGFRIRYNDVFDDANLPGVMEVTVVLKPVLCGTDVDISQAGIPEIIPLEMCYLGWQESLLQLAALVEPDIPG